MLYSEEELNQLEEFLEKKEVWELLEKLDGLIAKENFDLPSFTGMIEDAIKGYKTKAMYVVPARSEYRGLIETGFAVEFESHDGSELLNDSFYKTFRGEKDIERVKSILKDGSMSLVSSNIVHKLKEMAYMGYELRQPKKDEVVDF